MDEGEKLQKERKKWLKLMWATTIFTKKRVEYEKKANEAARKLAAYKKKHKGTGKGKSPAAGYPKEPPEKLWRMDPTTRPIDFFGVISGNLLGSAEDEVIAVAKGARTSFKSRPTDDRAVIRGGLSILYSLGKSKVDPKKLKSQIVQGPREDAKLVKAAGGGHDLKSAANVVRKRISALGKHIERAAWGARGLYILGNMPGFQAARGTGELVASLFGPIGLAVSAFMAVHGAISDAVAKEVVHRFTGYVKQGVAAARKVEEKREEQPTRSEGIAPPSPSSSGVPWFVWAGGAVIAVVLVVGSGRRASA